ncbi:MAG: type I polyketide synthase [Streptosporangiaceae bacterium]|jgi:enediyne polyketide synthase
MTGTRIAVVGVALRYPDAETPEDLWRNVLAGRRAFRNVPDERMRMEDYYSADPTAPDRHYTRKAAVLEGFEFDRVKYRIGGSTFRSTDMTHWLALDTVARALADAGFADGEGLPKTNTGVVIGNTLTGEFSRANLMRLRWPYVRRTVGAALREQGWDDQQLGVFLDRLEERYKTPFPPIDEDTLAGGLANTIAGRICNYFDFGGGGFTVDGACSSSLLSVATACNALTAGQIDAAIAGGVDLSIDPFEVVGFAKTGALAKKEMKVYDRDSQGFWPGEGCGILVLMRDEDALDMGKSRYATIAGWGYSSDGKGGLTRPEADGHRRAIKNAYEQAGFGFETISYLEGHGTGTAVGDATELTAFSEARRAAAGPAAPPIPIGTVKGNFGHTKGAAGVAGLIKAILAVKHQIIPPATSHHETHPVLAGDRPALRVPATAELFPEGRPVRAAVSSMGFGGINAHVVVEHADGTAPHRIDQATRNLVRSRQDAELLLLDAAGMAELRGQVAQLAALAPQMSFAELGDMAASLAGSLDNRPIRAAVVARSPEEAEQRLAKLLNMLDNGARSVLNTADGVYVGNAGVPPRIAFLFPGQGAGRRGDGGALRRRFAELDVLYQKQSLPTDGDLVATAVAQPRIVTASVAGLRVLSALGIEAVTAAGHSLGELTALHWAGAMDEETLLRAAATRGAVMAEASDGGGTMAGIAAAPEEVTPLLAGEPVVIAGYNSPTQTVISGPVDAVDRVSALAQARGLGAGRINVSHAFHSAAVAPAATAFRAYLEDQQFTPLERTMVSTVTGEHLPPTTDVPELLARQVLDPVRFSDAVQVMATEADLFIEVGPGRILRSLAAETVAAVPAISIESDSDSLAGLLNAVGAAYTLGAPVQYDVLFQDRYTRPFPLDKEFKFLASPCESAPEGDFATSGPGALAGSAGPDAPAAAAAQPAGGEPLDSLEVLRKLAAERAELPLEAVQSTSNPIDELHLSSITVGQIVNQAARDLGLPGVVTTSAFATSTLAEIAQMLDELGQTAQPDEAGKDTVPGVGPWVRAFDVSLVPADPGSPAGPAGAGRWELLAPSPHPLAQPLLDGLRQADLGDGVLLCLPRHADVEHIPLMIDAARAALSVTGDVRFVAVGGRKGAAGLAKTLHLEAPNVATTLVILPVPEDPTQQQVQEIVARITADVAATDGFSEVHYDSAGTRTVPILRPLPRASRASITGVGGALTEADVLLVTGGGKGITAECALTLGRESGAAIGILGRSAPSADAELAANLERLQKASVKFHYAQADVTAPDQVKAAVDEIQRTLGAVTAVLHGSGRNEPQALTNLDESSFRRTVAPKITGLENVLAATDPGALKLLITFGSIIGRAGLRGEADYSTANDWLTDLTKQTREQNPGCRCLALEWSVWAGAGMGERLGVLEALIREGIAPIPLQDGIDILVELLADPTTPDAVVIMGRAEGLPTITLEQRELPLTRFIERPQVHYAGVELVVDAELTAESDPYLSDHLLDGDLLFPAVIGMEAMTQAAAAVTGQEAAPTLEDVEFLRPIVVPVRGSSTIRIAVLAENPDTVHAVIRSSDTGFQADHFRATLRYSGPRPQGQVPEMADQSRPRVPVDPAAELYGSVLFQGGRFRRLLGYRKLAARECVAEISNVPGDGWFGDFLPPDLVLADPGTRDALMHSIQCCVPDATLLPAGIEQLHLTDPGRAADLGQVTLHARERSRDGDTYLYDLDIYDPAGSVIEQWRGLRLQAVRKEDGSGPWVPALLGPYLERNVEPALGGGLATAIYPDDGPLDGTESRRRQTATVLSGALGRVAEVTYRPDGRPLVEGIQVTASHGASVTFAVASQRQVSCDVELAADRPEDDWASLLGADGLELARLIASGRGESLSVAATRVWGAIECLRKTGHAIVTLVDASGPEAGRWVVLSSGSARIASFATRLNETSEPVVFTMLAEGDEVK